MILCALNNSSGASIVKVDTTISETKLATNAKETDEKHQNLTKVSNQYENKKILCTQVIF